MTDDPERALDPSPAPVFYLHVSVLGQTLGKAKCDAVLNALHAAGFQAGLANNGTQALDIFLNHPVDITILGMIPPILNGLRSYPVAEMPSLLIRNGKPDRQALDSNLTGSNGENVRLVRLSELIECVREFLQTGASPSAPAKPIYQFDFLVLDLNKRQVLKHGLPIATTPIEFRLLHYLMQHTNQVVTRDELLHNVWGCHKISGDFNLVVTAIKRLRKAIEDNPRQPGYIHTVWGVGYRFGECQIAAVEEPGRLGTIERAEIDECTY